MNADAIPIGTKIKIARIARGKRQRDLSQESRLPQATLSALENNYRLPRDYEIEAVLTALGVSRADLEKVRA